MPANAVRDFDRDTDGEVVEALKLMVRQSQDLVHRIVEVAADPRGTDARRLDELKGTGVIVVQ